LQVELLLYKKNFIIDSICDYQIRMYKIYNQKIQFKVLSKNLRIAIHYVNNA